MNPTDPLNELRGLTMPDPHWVSWWPLAPGWYFVLLLVLIALFYVVKLLKKRKADNWYKQAKRELASIRELNSSNEQEIYTRCSALCRRVAMAVEGREAIAGLTGKAWLAKLDKLVGSQAFTNGGAAVLDDRLWQKKAATSDSSAEDVLQAVAALIENNKPSFKNSRRAS